MGRAVALHAAFWIAAMLLAGAGLSLLLPAWLAFGLAGLGVLVVMALAALALIAARRRVT
jgi:hypothetical protein